MPFRTNNNTTKPCLVCATNTTKNCRNCRASHCEVHLVGTSCAGCASQLWASERREVKRIKLTTMGLAAVLTGATLALQTGMGITLELLAFGAYFGAAAIVTRQAGNYVRRRLAKLQLAPSSKPLALTAHSSDATETKAKESDYSIRRRRNKRVVRRRAPRAIFMTRGGYFYQ
jgi:hypothetical protein